MLEVLLFIIPLSLPPPPVEKDDVLPDIVVRLSLMCLVNQGWLNISGIVILVDALISSSLRIKSRQSILISSADL